jgi:hypothetical protein
MTDTSDKIDVRLIQLVLSLQAGAMQQMGKMVSVITGQIERDLELAKATIDMIEMLAERTKGNLTADEKHLIDHVLYELRLNYVDEAKKAESDTGKDASTPDKPSADPDGDKK